MSAAVSLPEFTAFSPSAFAMSWLFVGLLPSLISEGRSFSLWMMPVGTKYGHSTEAVTWSVTSRTTVGEPVSSVEFVPGRGGQIGRSAGAAIQLVAKEGGRATLRLPSGEMRMVPLDARASIGSIGNADHQNISIGKAGRNRHKGKRPQTRGTAMNPVDHPHGGGEGSTTPGRHPVTPWGVPTLGYPTRKKRKPSDRFIVRRRRRGKGKR